MYFFFFFFADRQAGNLPSVLGGGEPAGGAQPSTQRLGLSALESRAAQGELLMWETWVWFKISLSQADWCMESHTNIHESVEDTQNTYAHLCWICVYLLHDNKWNRNSIIYITPTFLSESICSFWKGRFTKIRKKQIYWLTAKDMEPCRQLPV